MGVVAIPFVIDIGSSSPICRRMRPPPYRCLRLQRPSLPQNQILVLSSPQCIRRWYAKPANPYTSTIILPKTDYELWPKHDIIRTRFLEKCVADCYTWQVSSHPNTLIIVHITW